ncbi:hypothetical protein [Priestia megaterium]|uniref:hypothetical protein n=1 Tax=Priestia megaterium TaxID=1404 RepID=UPI00390C9895
MKDNETKRQFISMRAKGISFDKIAKELKIAKSTLIEWSRTYLTEIKNLKSIEMEALQEQFYLTKASRIELLGLQLEKIKKELEKRDFSDVSSDKLIDIFSKILEQLKKEESEIIFTGKSEPIENLIAANNLVTWKPE